MMTGKFSPSRLIAAALVTSLAAGIVFYLLMGTPFGPMFHASFFVMTGSLAAALLLTAVAGFGTGKRLLRAMAVIPAAVGAALLLAMAAVTIDIRLIMSMTLPHHPTKDEWIRDVRFLAEQMETKYPNLYGRISEEKFKAAVNEIEARIPGLSEEDIVMEVFRLTALPNDAHTIPFVFLPSYDLHDFPLKLYRFDDGWFIIDAAREHSGLIGTKLVKIGSTPIEDIVRKYRPYLSAENEYARLERFTYIGLIPEWLRSQGVIDNLKEARFTVRKENGEEFAETVRAVQLPFKLYWSSIVSVDNRTAPPVLNPRKDWYWFEFIESSRTIYFQFSEVQNQGGKETIAACAKRLKEFADTHEFDRLIVDIRNNQGGDDRYLNELIALMRDSKKINRPNTLLVLIGRHTFSSGVLFAHQLRLQTKAVFIGEPTGQGPVFAGNPRTVELPNSKLVVAIATTSTARTQSPWPFTVSDAIAPDTLVPYVHADFRSGRDPVMEAALHYRAAEKTSAPLPDNVLDRYAGRYLLGTFHMLDVKRSGRGLSFTIDDFVPRSRFRVQSDLAAVSEHEFTTDIPNVSVAFPTTQAGPAASLLLTWEGQQKPARRVPNDTTFTMELIAQKRFAEALPRILAKKEEFHRLAFIENTLINAGYELLNQNRMQEAIDVFVAVVEVFPGSWNAYDSLGEAYMKAGNRELAIKNYERSLALNPANTGGAEALKQLKSGE